MLRRAEEFKNLRETGLFLVGPTHPKSGNWIRKTETEVIAITKTGTRGEKKC